MFQYFYRISNNILRSTRRGTYYIVFGGGHFFFCNIPLWHKSAHTYDDYKKKRYSYILLDTNTFVTSPKVYAVVLQRWVALICVLLLNKYSKYNLITINKGFFQKCKLHLFKKILINNILISLKLYKICINILKYK